MCGSCHSDAQFMKRYNPSLRVDQVAEYVTSDHGRRLLQDDDPDVATCVDCHPAHHILPPSDPASSVHPLNVARTCGHCHGDAKLMARHNVPGTPVADYGRSVHARLLQGGDLSAPTCNDCHGNHGAVPPGVASIRNVCGQCHATMADYFTASGHERFFTRAGLPGCVTCHGNHAIQKPSDAFLLVAGQRVCTRCHTGANADGFRRMNGLLTSLAHDSALGAELLDRAENDGMEVSQAQFELRDLSTVFTRARGAVHSFQVDTLAQAVAAGRKLTTKAIERGHQALRDHLVRREGLAFSSTFILALVVGLVIKLRRLEAPDGDPRGRRPDAGRREET
jgi:predicted CXXCH cytochrome family protein